MYEYLDPISREWIICGFTHYMSAVPGESPIFDYYQPGRVSGFTLRRLRPLYFRFRQPHDISGTQIKVREVDYLLVEGEIVYFFDRLTEMEKLMLDSNTITRLTY